jgi:hypothetical protein
MHHAVEQLVQILGAPPVENTLVPWDQAPAEIGFQFPSDYREFLDIYGSIAIRDELSIWSPSLRPDVPGRPGGFPGFVDGTTFGVGEHLADAFEEGNFRECPYPVFPAPGGVLGWANNPNVDHCFWLTEGNDPDRWPIVIWYRQGGEWDRFDGGMAEFILAVVTGRYPMADDIAPEEPGVPLWTPRGDWLDWKKRDLTQPRAAI